MSPPLSAIVLAIAILGTSSCAEENRRKRTDDEAVIEVAMLAFFEKSDWNTVDWSRGDFVFLNPAFSSKERPDFGKAVERAKADFKNWPKESIDKAPDEYQKSLADAAKLEDIEKSLKSPGPDYAPAAIPDLARMTLDRRIVVAEFPGSWYTNLNKPVRDMQGKEGRARVSARIHPPGYSADGKYAVVSGYAPWSMHGASFHFFLRRDGTEWKVVVVHPVYYF